MPENAIIPDGIIPSEEAVPETAKEKFERERLSRRQALKKFGMTSAMATFALFSVDDLAHMVGKAMQQRAADNKVVEQVAKEFQQAGIALAEAGTPCSHCLAQYNQDLTDANKVWTKCVADKSLDPSIGAVQAQQMCNADLCKTMNDKIFDYNGCCNVNCPPGTCQTQPMPTCCNWLLLG